MRSCLPASQQSGVLEIYVNKKNARQLLQYGAAMVFQSSDLEKLGQEGGGPDAALLKKLRDEAQISRR